MLLLRFFIFKLLVWFNINLNRRMEKCTNAECRVSHHTIFARIYQFLHEIGTYKKQTGDCGNPREVSTVQLEKAVLEIVAVSPETSTGKVANILNVSNVTLFEILNEQQLYLFHIQSVLVLLTRGFWPRLVFCQ